MICLIECLDRVGVLFLSDLSRQKCTKYTSQQGFDVRDSPTGHGEERMGFRRQQTQMETGHQMCRTRDRTADRVRGIKQREPALLSECAVQTRSIALLRVRGEGQHNTIREVTLDEDRHEYRTASEVRGEGQHNTVRDVTPDGEI